MPFSIWMFSALPSSGDSPLLCFWACDHSHILFLPLTPPPCFALACTKITGKLQSVDLLLPKAKGHTNPRLSNGPRSSFCLLVWGWLLTKKREFSVFFYRPRCSVVKHKLLDFTGSERCAFCCRGRRLQALQSKTLCHPSPKRLIRVNHCVGGGQFASSETDSGGFFFPQGFVTRRVQGEAFLLRSTSKCVGKTQGAHCSMPWPNTLQSIVLVAKTLFFPLSLHSTWRTVTQPSSDGQAELEWKNHTGFVPLAELLKRLDIAVEGSLRQWQGLDCATILLLTFGDDTAVSAGGWFALNNA